MSRAVERGGRAAAVIVALVVILVVGALAARFGGREAESGVVLADAPTVPWDPPTTTAPAAVAVPAAAPLALPAMAPADAPFSTYFDGTMRIRNIQRGALGVGTAFVIGDGTFALTNRHVVQDATSLQLETWDGVSRGSATVLAIGPDSTDLALLKLPAALDRPLPLAPEAPSLDTELTAGGYPEAHQFTRSIGHLLAVTSQDGMNMLVTDVPAAPGSSGSPLLSPTGEVVGIIFGGSYNGYTLAVPIADVHAMLDSQHVDA